MLACVGGAQSCCRRCHGRTALPAFIPSRYGHGDVLQQNSDCSHVQIIPTVNCGKGDAEGEKRVAGMLKHFRGLVDENAAKSRFLSAFRKKGSRRC